MPELTQELYRDLFIYNPESGALRWRKTLRGHLRGDMAGHESRQGYVLSYHGRALLAHQIIWLMQTGQTAGRIRHLNGDKLDNRWANLQAVETPRHRAHLKRLRDPQAALPRPRGLPDPQTQATLRQAYCYITSTGAFTWRMDHSRHHRAGSRAWRATRSGAQMRLGSRWVSLPKMLWIYMTGEIPPGPVRMRDKNRLNLCWDNLYVLDPRDRATPTAHPGLGELKRRARKLTGG